MDTTKRQKRPNETEEDEEQEEQHGKDSNGQKKSKKRNEIPKAAKEALMEWLFDNATNPYPSQDEKIALSTRTGLNLDQIKNWFINARRRYLQSMQSPDVTTNLKRKRPLLILNQLQQHSLGGTDDIVEEFDAGAIPSPIWIKHINSDNPESYTLFVLIMRNHAVRYEVDVESEDRVIAISTTSRLPPAFAKEFTDVARLPSDIVKDWPTNTLCYRVQCHHPVNGPKNISKEGSRLLILKFGAKTHDDD